MPTSTPVLNQHVQHSVLGDQLLDSKPTQILLFFTRRGGIRDIWQASSGPYT